MGRGLFPFETIPVHGKVLFVLPVKRSHVEAGYTGQVQKALAVLREHGAKVRQSMVFSFEGYDDVPDEVYEIQDVRRWCGKVVEKFPYIFYYLAPFPGGLVEFTACLGDVEVIKPLCLRKPTNLLTPEEMMTGIPLHITLPIALARTIASATLRYGINEMGESEESILQLIQRVPGLNPDSFGG